VGLARLRFGESTLSPDIPAMAVTYEGAGTDAFVEPSARQRMLRLPSVSAALRGRKRRGRIC
jgi:hypothetical protein